VHAQKRTRGLRRPNDRAGRKKLVGIRALEALEDRCLLTLLGQQLFPSDNPWNQNIANAPVAANSTQIINSIIALNGSDGRFHPDFGQFYGTGPLYGIPFNIVHGNALPKVHVVVGVSASESDLQDAPIPANAVIEGDTQSGPTAGLANRGDSHLIVWDEDNNVAYEFYHASRPSENGDGMWHADQETVWDMKTDTFRTLDWTSADAAGLSILPGLVRPDEGLPVSQGGQGVINHAIRMTLENNVILNQFLYPASHRANPGNTDPSIEPPMGARFRLKASVDISQLNPESKIIAQAMKDYGLIVADNGSDFFFSGATYSVDANNNRTLTWDDNDIQDTAHGLKSLHYSDFELVDTTPIVTGLSTTSAPAGATVTVIGQNFSGAAGHLQVLFNGAPASNVVVIDDSHVSATVPAGSGTVDVEVQSGATVPNDPENVKGTIFGYGISQKNAVDKFTYTVGPLPPPAPVLDPASDTGISHSDDITKATTLVFDMTATFSGATLQLYRDGNLVGTGTVGASLTTMITDQGPVPEGSHVYTAKQVDSSNNVSGPSPGLTVKVITTPPSVATLALDPADDSGISNSDGITNVNRPHFDVTGAVSGDFYDLLGPGGAVLATVTAAGPTLMLQPTTAFPDGAITLQVRADDFAGNMTLGGTTSITIITTPPPMQTVALNPADDSGISNSDGITNVVRPHFNVAGAVVGDFYDLLGNAGAVLATATAAATSFQIQPTAPLPEGAILIGLRARDVAGNSSLSATVPIKIITTPPPVPGLALNPADDSGPSHSDGITNVVRPRFTVSGAVAGDFYDLLGPGNAVLATGTAAGSSLTLQPVSALPDGAILIGLRARDVAGNATAGPSVAITIITVPPAPPSLSLSPADAVAGATGATARTRRPHLTGTTQAGASIQLFDAANHLLGSTTASAGGAFVVQPTLNLPIGTITLTARATDLAGNTSTLGQPLSLTVASRSRSAMGFADYNGDGKTDIALYDATAAQFLIQLSGGGTMYRVFGNPAHVNVPVSGDFDGDGKTDIGVYDQTAAQFFIQLSGGGAIVQKFGNPADKSIPVAGDFDGDGKTDIGIYDQTASEFFILLSGGGSIVKKFGNPADTNIPIVGDFDGDGKTDLGIYDQIASEFFIQLSGGGAIVK
jgi:hypothetical protein